MDNNLLERMSLLQYLNQNKKDFGLLDEDIILDYEKSKKTIILIVSKSNNENNIIILNTNDKNMQKLFSNFEENSIFLQVYIDTLKIYILYLNQIFKEFYDKTIKEPFSSEPLEMIQNLNTFKTVMKSTMDFCNYQLPKNNCHKWYYYTEEEINYILFNYINELENILKKYNLFYTPKEDFIDHIFDELIIGLEKYDPSIEKETPDIETYQKKKNKRKEEDL